MDHKKGEFPKVRGKKQERAVHGSKAYFGDYSFVFSLPMLPNTSRVGGFVATQGTLIPEPWHSLIPLVKKINKNVKMIPCFDG